MKRLMIFISIVTIMCCSVSGATVSVVKNGSFEYDGYMDVTPTSIPQYWCNVSYNANDFTAYLDNYWVTDGSYSLAILNLRHATLQTDTATITQSVYLTNADQISFDLYLSASNGNWNTAMATAKVLIDGNAVWDSNGLSYIAGEFMGNVAIDVNTIYKDEYPHTLSLQLAINVKTVNFVQYYVQWDSVAFDSPCGAGGYLPADLTHDCRVDINDLAVFAEGWLTPNGLGLTSDNDVNFVDFAVFADYWMSDTRGEPFIPGPDFIFLDGDLNDDGIVDYSDVLVLCDNWLGSGGYCVREDLNEDGFIDFTDLALLAEQWREIGDLYGL
jgi:hypothetical protein